LALFEDSDVLCVANREGQEVSCMRAGLFSYPAKDVTGTQVTNYKNMGRVYAIAEKGIVVFHSFQITRSFYLPTSNTYVLFSNVSFSANESLSRKSIEVQKPIYEN
jgi:hypothetical protein